MSNSRVAIRITKIEIAPPSAAIRVGYQVFIENPAFSGPIAGGETQLVDDELGLRAEQFIQALQSKIEQGLGVEPGAVDEEVEEEEL